MSTAWTWRASIWVLLMSSAWAPVVHASDAPRSSDTTRLIDRIEKSRSGQTPADLSAARRLNADGDRAYKQRNYRAAFTAYSNSYPNSPNAYAYIMAGDAYWRGVVQYHEREARKPADGDAGCRIDNSHFAHDLATDVAQHHAVGLALASRGKDQRLLHSSLYQRARDSAACLQTLAQHYEAQPRSSCIDLDRMRRCLGPPLPADDLEPASRP